jgi:hypothetical protein
LTEETKNIIEDSIQDNNMTGWIDQIEIDVEMLA